MIVRTKTGRGFLGCLLYVMHGDKEQTQDKGAHLVGGNMAGTTARSLSREFGQLRKLRPGLGKAVSHTSLSFALEDRRLSDAEMADIAAEFVEAMGFKSSAYVCFRHEDTEHQHCHIVSARVDCKTGEAVSDSNSFRRAEAVARCLEIKHGLKTVAKKEKKPMENSTQGANDANGIVDDEALGEPVFTIEAGEALSSAKARELRRRAATSAEYRALVIAALGSSFKGCTTTNWGLSIALTDGGRILDRGDSLRCYRTTDETAAKALVSIGVVKGWGAMRFSGSPSFLRLAFIEALASGIVIVPKDDAQRAILKTLTDAARVEEQAAMNAAANATNAKLVAELRSMAAATIPKTLTSEADEAARQLRALHIEALKEERAEKTERTKASPHDMQGIGNAWERLKARREENWTPPTDGGRTAPKGPK